MSGPIVVKDVEGIKHTLPVVTDVFGSDQPVQIAKSLATSINNGEIAGASVSVKFGGIPTLNTGDAPADIWPLGKTVPLIPQKFAGATLSVVSDSTQDNSGGTGAFAVTIEGIDENWDAISETINLNGTSAVTTTGSFIAVNRAFIEEVGNDDDGNVGNISMTHTGDIIGYIQAMEGQTEQTMLTTPRNTKTQIIGPFVGIIKSGTGRTLSARIRSKEFGKGWRTRSYGEVTSSGTSYLQTPAGDVPIFSVGEKARVKLTVFDLSTNDTGAVGGYGYLILPTA